MSEQDLRHQLAEAQETIHTLRQELADTNQGLLALTLELEDRVAERTTELRMAQEELAQTNRDLVQLTWELEDRVAQRTVELQAKDEEMRAVSQQLWQAAKLATMGELAASIAHELNNPLGTVTLRVEALMAQVSRDDPKWRGLTVIEQEVDRMANLIGNLLEFSRRGFQQISTVDVREEIVKTLELVYYHLRKRGIGVVRQFAPDVPMLHADRQQLRQLFLNLFTNASDAMSEGGTLTIRVAPLRSSESLDPARKRVLVEVADTGCGMAPDILSMVMEPFFTTKPEGKGTGLGLSICRRIVQGHQGKLGIASEPGRGTTVRIELPAANGANGRWVRED